MATKEREIEYPEWQLAYRDALLECDPLKLPAKTFEAETMIVARLNALQASSDGHIERQAIQDALNGLRTLQRHRLNYPAWESA